MTKQKYTQAFKNATSKLAPNISLASGEDFVLALFWFGGKI